MLLREVEDPQLQRKESSHGTLVQTVSCFLAATVVQPSLQDVSAAQVLSETFVRLCSLKMHVVLRFTD